MADESKKELSQLRADYDQMRIKFESMDDDLQEAQQTV